MRFLFPRTLNRRCYALRFLLLWGLLSFAAWLYKPSGLIDGGVYYLWAGVLWVYWAFGLAVPRLRKAGLPPLLALLCGVMPINIALAVFLFAAQEKPISSTASPVASPPPLPGRSPC